MDGQVIQQTSLYRQGVVLGLTMAEIVLLLVFCLLIAMGSFLRKEQVNRAKLEEQLEKLKAEAQADRDFIASLEKNKELIERLKQSRDLGEVASVDEFWRELVESRAIVAGLRKGGIAPQDIRKLVSNARRMKERELDVDKAIRGAAIVDALSKVFPDASNASKTAEEVVDGILKKMEAGKGLSGHRWPPIINLSEADGYYFKSGSAELSQEFRQVLMEKTTQRIAELIRQYDVDVIEVVGHTDEQPLGLRQSNLDRELVSVLRKNSTIASLVPADNAGLGLARAVSVVNVLLQSKSLNGYKIVPLSGAQLVNIDETLAVSGTPGDVPQRRRIEIRLRKSVQAERPANRPVTREDMTLPRPRPQPKRTPEVPTPAPVQRAAPSPLVITPN